MVKEIYGHCKNDEFESCMKTLKNKQYSTLVFAIIQTSKILRSVHFLRNSLYENFLQKESDLVTLYNTIHSDYK